MKKRVLTVAVIILMLTLFVIGVLWVYFRSPIIQMWRYLSGKEYTSVTLERVRLVNYGKDELLICYGYSAMTPDVMQESLQIKKDVEWFLAQNSEIYNGLIINLDISEDFEPSGIWMYNGDNDGYQSIKTNELGFGWFSCPDCSIFAFDDTVQFDTLRLIRFKDMESLTEVLPLQSNLQRLELLVDDEFANDEIEKLCNALPDCTIIINGKTLQQGE